MRIEDGPKLDFSDVLIRPKRSTLGSRAEVDVNRTFRSLHTGSEWTGFPLIAANMDTTGTFAMAKALLPFGALRGGSGNLDRGVEWSFCLTAARMAAEQERR